MLISIIIIIIFLTIILIVIAIKIVVIVLTVNTIIILKYLFYSSNAEIYNYTMDILDKGNVLLELLEEAITQADVNCKHAAKSAYYGIERTVEALYTRKKKIEEAWRDRKKILEQSVESCRLDSDIKMV